MTIERANFLFKIDYTYRELALGVQLWHYDNHEAIRRHITGIKIDLVFFMIVFEVFP